MGKTKVLLLGSPRSGTSLLAGMLGSHPDVAMLWEDRAYAIKRLVGKRVVGNKLCVPNQIRRHTTWLERATRRYGWFVFRDKSAVSIEHYLQDQDLRLLLIVRAPKAIVSSMMRRGGLSLREATSRWRRGVQILDELARDENDRSLVVRFEGLVESPQDTMKAVSTFLDLPFNEHMLEGHKHTKLYNQHDGIDTSKGTQTSTQIDIDLQEAHPEAFEGYERLCHQASVQPVKLV